MYFKATCCFDITKAKVFYKSRLSIYHFSGGFAGFTAPKTAFYLKIFLSYLNNGVVLLLPLFGLRYSKDLY